MGFNLGFKGLNSLIPFSRPIVIYKNETTRRKREIILMKFYNE